jgi:hypothetical protein
MTPELMMMMMPDIMHRESAGSAPATCERTIKRIWARATMESNKQRARAATKRPSACGMERGEK